MDSEINKTNLDMAFCLCLVPLSILVLGTNALTTVSSATTQQTVVDEGKTEVRVALLFPNNMPLVEDRMGFSSSAGAVSVALDRIRRENLVPNIKWSFLTRFSQCDESEAAGIALDVIKRANCSVIIGPPCSIPAIAVAVLSKAFNVAQVSWAATTTDLANHNRFPTLVRTIGSALRIGRALKEVLIYFGWRRIALIYTQDKSTRKCFSIAEGLRKMLGKADLTISYSLAIDKETATAEDMDQFLTELPLLARIVVACFEQDTDTRSFMLRAQELALTGREYVYILPDYVRDPNRTEIWNQQKDSQNLDHRNYEAKRAFMSTFFMEMMLSKSETLHSFRSQIIRKVKGPPFYHEPPKSKKSYGSLFSPFLHDAMYLYALALNKTLAAGHSFHDGKRVIAAAKNTQFQGYSGHVVIDKTAGREPNFVLRAFSADLEMKDVAHANMYKEDGKTLKMLIPERLIWEARGGFVPQDSPVCGFRNEKCKYIEEQSVLAVVIVSVVVGSLCLMAIVTGVAAYVKRQLASSELAKMLWKINYRDIIYLNQKDQGKRSRSLGSMRSITTTASHNDETAAAIAKGEANAAQWKMILVWAKSHKTSLVLSSEADHLHLKHMRNLNNENLNQFMGVCVDGPHPISVWKYNTKGSLEDVVNNESVRLDWFFKYSFLKDIVAGMDYLHESSIKTHGCLRSSSCVVDNRWTIKVSDYGLYKMRHRLTEAKDRLWTAPEFLRIKDTLTVSKGSQKGDVYSFAIIIQEVIARDRPYYIDEVSLEDVIERVAKVEKPPFRPTIQNDLLEADTDQAVIQLMKDSWKEDPEGRPSFASVIQEEKNLTIRQMGRGKTINLMDHVLKMMEKYAGGLEQTVADRTKQLTEEIEKADLLLQRLLPRSVADKLKSGQSVEPLSYEAATVLFSDVVGFTTIASRSTPMETVVLLNALYTLFDDVIAEYDVYKVETIGDGYVCASGLPHKNGDLHASQMADMALQLISEIKTFVMPHLPDDQIQLRIGIHTGKVVAGVVGTAMPRYCLFGDTVNVANRMESTGKASCIQISEQTHRYLTEIIGGYITKPRGEIIIKGKGVLFTYWLLAKSASNIQDRTDGEGAPEAAESSGGTATTSAEKKRPNRRMESVNKDKQSSSEENQSQPDKPRRRKKPNKRRVAPSPALIE